MRDLALRLGVSLGLLAAASGPAFAGSEYAFVTETRNSLDVSTSKGRLIVEGEKFRIERQPSEDALYLSIPVEISKDGGAHRFALNPGERTYFELEKIEAPITSPLFFLIPSYGDRSVENVNVETVQGTEPEVIDGGTVKRYEITLSYDLTLKIPPPPPPPGRPPFKGPGETVRGKVKLVATYWMAEDLAPLPDGIFAPQIHTGFSEIDGKLAAALASLPGLAVRQQMTIRTEGSPYVPSRSDWTSTTVERPRPVKTSAAQFEVPSGFKMHKPEFTRPGMGDVPHTLSLPGAEGPP